MQTDGSFSLHTFTDGLHIFYTRKSIIFAQIFIYCVRYPKHTVYKLMGRFCCNKSKLAVLRHIISWYRLYVNFPRHHIACLLFTINKCWFSSECTNFVVKRWVLFDIVEIFRKTELSALFVYRYKVMIYIKFRVTTQIKDDDKDLWCIIERSIYMVLSDVIGMKLKIWVVSKHYVFVWSVRSWNDRQ